jgi:hypothetical protein
MPLISVTGERERPPLRYLDRPKEVAILQATGYRFFGLLKQCSTIFQQSLQSRVMRI